MAAHFNAAGSALPTGDVVAAVVDHLRLEELVGGYEAAAEARPRIEAVYRSAAELIGATEREIALFDSASTGLRVILEALRPGARSRVIASRSTYVSHALHLMTLARECGAELVVLPTDAERRVDLAELDRLLRTGPPAIVTVAHVPTSSGLVEPVADIGRIVAEHGGTYVLDATQSVGQLVTDVAAIGCDVMVTTGRKFLRAPRGTAFAYVADRLTAALEPTSPDVRATHWTSALDWEVEASARRFESWESSVAGRLGLGRALDEARERGMEETAAWLCAAGADLRARLAVTPGVTIADPAGASSAIVTFVVDGVAAADVVVRLAADGVRVVSVPATHGQWDLGDRGIRAVVRASPHVYNDENDIAALVAAVARIASGKESA
ncbi:MAG: aminotransferase class V-fold PLP-dependent enzyme [Microbacterium sp.]